MLGCESSILTDPHALQSIFFHFSFKELSTVLTVCKAWNETLGQNEFWKKYFSPEYQLKHTDSYKAEIKHLHPRIITKKTLKQLLQDFETFIQTVPLDQKALFSCKILNRSESIDFTFGASRFLAGASHLESNQVVCHRKQVHWLYIENPEPIYFLKDEPPRVESIEMNSPNYAFIIKETDINELNEASIPLFEKLLKKTETLWLERASKLHPEPGFNLEIGILITFFFTWPLLHD